MSWNNRDLKVRDYIITKQLFVIFVVFSHPNMSFVKLSILNFGVHVSEGFFFFFFFFYKILCIVQQWIHK